jgi:glycosyltransferase involved in cell wall biosynthesis
MELPTVSICTPTYNRRPFIKHVMQCFLHQTYPQDKMEWIIIDDGTDKIQDIIEEANLPNIRYFERDRKMTLGKKRNLLHRKCRNDIIIYMDDDDYYPPERVEHAVQQLLDNPDKLCAGSDIMYIYFPDQDKIFQFGPYGKNHATAGTFAFRKELLKQCKYNDEKKSGEEMDFLKNYTIPIIQLDPEKTILVINHGKNTIDKRMMLIMSKSVKPTELKIENFVKDNELLAFYKQYNPKN